MTFNFNIRATEEDSKGYYVTRWDRAINITVTAETREEATNKALSVLGKPRYHTGDRWVFHIDSINEVKP